jgi:hypothetical protein
VFILKLNKKTKEKSTATAETKKNKAGNVSCICAVSVIGLELVPVY